MQTHSYEYDAFISHAVEDKLAIANELCSRLEKEDLKIWYSGKELSVGDSVKSTIEEGLRNSRLGIVILSKNYVEKTWPMQELFHFLSRHGDEEKKLLPVLFEITVEELADLHLPLADIYSLKYERGMDYVVAGLLDAIKKEIEKDGERIRVEKIEIARKSAIEKKEKTWRRWLVAISAVLLTTVGTFIGMLPWNNEIPEGLVNEAITNRINNLEEKVRLNLNAAMQTDRGSKIRNTAVDSAYIAYHAIKSHYRNEYLVNTGQTSVKSKKKVEALLQTDVDVLAPSNLYGLKNADWYRFSGRMSGKVPILHFGLLNREPVNFTISESKSIDEHQLFVTVAYTNNIRFISVQLQFPENDMKRQITSLTTLPPKEVYHFKNNGGTWELAGIE